MQSRAGRPEYRALLADCHSAYCEARLGLLAPVVQDRVADYAARLPLPQLLRAGFSYLLQARG